MRRSKEVLAVACATLLCGLVLSGCGGGTSGDTGGGGGTGGTNGSGTVGTSGGTVSLPSGPTVVVPSGALPADRTITVAVSTTAAPAGALGSLYQFGPAGTTFTTPVTVNFPVPTGTTAASAAIYWTKLGSTTEWDILPTTVSGTTATASVTHFSAGYVGAASAIDISGTWANAALNQTLTPPGGSPGAAPSIAHSRDLVQTGSAFTYTAVNGSGFRATCTGTLAGTSVVATCDAISLDGSCTSHYTQTGTVIPGSPMTMTTDSTLVLGGASCLGVGYAYHVTGTLTRQATPVLDVSGTYSVTTSFTRTGPNLPPQPGTSQGTRVRTQTGSSGSSTLTTATVTTNCRGPIIGNVVYDGCSGLATNGAIYSGTSASTVSVGPPMTIAGSGTYAIKNDPSGYTQMTWTATATGSAGACNALVNSAPLVNPAYVASIVPAAAGGAIVDGTYYATANRVYSGVGGTSGPSTEQIRVVFTFQSGVVNWVNWHTGLSADIRGTGSLAVSGNLLTITPTCGTGPPEPFGFTASGSTIQFIFTNACTAIPCDLGSDVILTRQGAAAFAP
jgi:hypothetical protein